VFVGGGCGVLFSCLHLVIALIIPFKIPHIYHIVKKFQNKIISNIYEMQPIKLSKIKLVTLWKGGIRYSKSLSMISKLL